MQTAIRGINHVGIRVTDLEQSRPFYAKLGFEFVVGPIGPEPVAILRHPSGISLNLILNANVPPDKNILIDFPEKRAGYTHVALDVSDLDVVRQVLERQSIEISEGPVDLPDGGRMLFVRDPDQNVIEFHQNP
ncbi:MAG: VOC family protein [Gammaproteobacteria bacterium]|nr:MAG: VOC family protein [Gammaproteobacteria bacterium]